MFSGTVKFLGKLSREIKSQTLFGPSSEWVLYLVPTEADKMQRITQAKEIISTTASSIRPCWLLLLLILKRIRPPRSTGGSKEFVWCNEGIIPTGRAVLWLLLLMIRAIQMITYCRKIVMRRFFSAVASEGFFCYRESRLLCVSQ